MGKILKELKNELLNKVMSLLELDNKVQGILGTTESLYDYLNDVIEQKACSYYIDSEFEGIIIEFEILDSDFETKLAENDDYKFDMLVKVNYIFY